MRRTVSRSQYATKFASCDRSRVPRQVARHLMAGRSGAQEWLLRAANRHDVWASCVKVAACWRIECARDLARKTRAAPPATVLRAQHRHGGNQRLRVRMLGVRVDGALLCYLNDLAEIHHCHSVRNVLHHAEIMSDEQIGQSELGLQILHRLTIWACTETSSAETGSSHTTKRGFSASARAMPIRWR